MPMKVSFASSDEHGSELKIYSYRWYILAMFCGLEFTNALFWVTFSPISDIAQHYFGSGSFYSSTTGVNMLANVFLIFYAPGTLLGVLLMKRMGLKYSFIVAGTLTFLGALLRFIATSSSLSHGSTYWLVFLGQVLVALAQPIFLNMPPAVASIWFPTKERDIATTIGSMCSPIGNAVGQIIPILLVTEKSSTVVTNGETETVYDVNGMSDLMLVELIISVIPLAITIIAFRDAPPTPPSQSTKLKQQNATRIANAAKRGTGGSESFSHSMSAHLGEPAIGNETSAQLWEELRILWNCSDYWILFSVFAIGVGFFNSLMTLLNQIISPFGYSNDDAGTLGAVFILFGIVAAGVMGHVMERTRAYRTLLTGGIIACVLAVLLFVLMLFSNNVWPLTVSFALLGTAVIPLLPVMMENCAEVTYPVPEDLSMGLMFIGSNLVGLAFIFVLQALLELPAWGPPPLLPSNAFIVGILTVAALLVSRYKGDYKRMHLETDSSLHNAIVDPSDSETLLCDPMSTNPMGSGGASSLEDSGLVRVASRDNSSHAWHPSVSGHRPSNATGTFWNA